MLKTLNKRILKKFYIFITLIFINGPIATSNADSLLILTPETIIDRDESLVKDVYEEYQKLPDYLKGNSEQFYYDLQYMLDYIKFTFSDIGCHFGASSQVTAIRFFNAIKVGDFGQSLKEEATYALKKIGERHFDGYNITIDSIHKILKKINSKRDAIKLHWLMGDRTIQLDIFSSDYGTYVPQIVNLKPNTRLTSEFYIEGLKQYLNYFSEIRNLNDVLRGIEDHECYSSADSTNAIRLDHVDLICPIGKPYVSTNLRTRVIEGGETAANDLFYSITRGNGIKTVFDPTIGEFKKVRLEDGTIVKYISIGQRSALYLKDFIAKIEVINTKQMPGGNISLLFNKTKQIYTPEELNKRWSEKENEVEGKIKNKNVSFVDLEYAKIEKDVIEFVKEKSIENGLLPANMQDVIGILTEAEFVENNLEKLSSYYNDGQFPRGHIYEVLIGNMPVKNPNGGIKFVRPTNTIPKKISYSDKISAPLSGSNIDDLKSQIMADRWEMLEDAGELLLSHYVANKLVKEPFEGIVVPWLHFKKAAKALLDAIGILFCITTPDGIEDLPDLAKPKSSSQSNISKKKGWEIGDDNYKETAKGKDPSWSTVKNRFWKNKANKLTPDEMNELEKLKPGNVERMKQGKPPQKYNDKKFDKYGNGWESKELHHNPIPKREGGKTIEDLWPEEHAMKDNFRILGY